MNPQELEILNGKIISLEREIEDLKFILHRKTGGGSSDLRSNIVQPSTLPGGSITAGSIDKAAIGSNAVGDSELDYEFADVTITGTNTSGTSGVTSGSIPIGYYLTAFTTPVASYVQLAVSGTTLTLTLSTAPGAGNSCTFRAVLIKL